MTDSKLTFFGDVYVPEVVDSELTFGGRWIINLEAPITQSTLPLPEKVVLRTEEALAISLFKERLGGVCLANNHISDYGQQGIRDTFAELDRFGIPYFGAGLLANDCNNPLRLDIAGLRVFLFAYTDVFPAGWAKGDTLGTSKIDLDAIARDITKAKGEGADRVVVSLHWGAENVYLPKKRDIEIARQIVRDGADLIIGHHAHCVQPFEVFEGRHIFYGLGNCIFPDLALPAFFDNEGNPGRIHAKRQHYWNKQSLAVQFDPISGTVNGYVLHFDGNRLKLVSDDISRFQQNFGDLKRYEGRFKRNCLFCKARKKIYDWRVNPKVPTPWGAAAKLKLWRQNFGKH